MAQGKIRQDLFYRINVMRIDIPSLQEHAEDIRQLATHFLLKYCEQYQRVLESIHPDAMALLQSYAWPGNVRELENVIQRAIILADDECIRVQDLPQNIQEETVVSIDDYLPTGSFERQLRDYKIQLAMTALRENNGSKTLAARSLSISRAYLYRLIRTVEPDPTIDPEGQQLGSSEHCDCVFKGQAGSLARSRTEAILLISRGAELHADYARGCNGKIAFR